MEAARATPAPTSLETRRASGGLTLSPAATPRPGENARLLAPLELPPPPRISGAFLATLAALAGLAAIALGTWAFASEVTKEDAPRIVRPAVSGAAQAIALLSKPSTTRLPFAGSDGRVVLAVASNGRGLLVIDGLGIAPVGRTYQAWVVTRGSGRPPLSAALFTGVETAVPLTARVQPGSTVGISIERRGGAPAPTRPLALLAQRPP